jgi:hypothetical protein
VRHYAPEAARQASALGAHREAAAHYKTALDHLPAIDIEERASLLEARSHECYLFDEIDRGTHRKRRGPRAETSARQPVEGRG